MSSFGGFLNSEHNEINGFFVDGLPEHNEINGFFVGSSDQLLT